MVLDASYAQQRQLNAKRIENSQRATAQALQEMHETRRAPIPFAPYIECPPLVCPLPRDGHFVRTSDLVKMAPPKPYVATTRGFDGMIASGTPWTTYVKPQPSIFGRSQALQEHGEGQQTAKPALDKLALLTQHNEWTLQKNNYQPDIAAAMRIDVRKSAYLALHIGENRPDPNESLQNSANVKGALGEGVPPHMITKKSQYLTADMVFPREREV
jgi:hypothetical protein